MFIIFSCNKPVSREELINYINEPKNGCMKSNQHKGCNVSVFYRPIEIIAYGELVKEKGKSQEAVDSVRQLYSKNLYFIISLSVNEYDYLQKYVNNLSEYNNVVSYLNYGIQTDLKLIIPGKSSYYPIDCIFTRAYEVSNTNNILVVFNKEVINNEKEFTIQFNSVRKDIGSHSFSFNIKDLETIPEIIIY